MSLAEIRHSVAALKRKLAKELRLVRARRVANEYCDQWANLMRCKKLPSDPFRLLAKLLKHTTCAGRFSAAHAYLSQCRRNRHLPQPDDLLLRLLPGEVSLGIL